MTGWGACFRSATGEMYFGGFSGLASFVPERIVVDNSVPPIVLTDFQLFGDSVRIGKHSILKEAIAHTAQIILSHEQNIFAIEFSALSYLNAPSIRYRYKLEGLDAAWTVSDSDHRVASYTALPHGTYTFRVEAATSHGLWGEPGAALRIRILPPWWETPWFLSLSIFFSLTLLWSLYRGNLNRATAEIRTRMEERLRERERIARELHDTLLQGFISASMQLDVAADRLPDDSLAKLSISRILKMMARVIEDGRNALHALRSTGDKDHNLEMAFSRMREEFALPEALDYRVIAHGATRRLRPLIRDEVYLIGREALVNAFLHSGANAVVVEVEYANGHFKVIVRDDGRGMDSQVLDFGREGHWGLRGMRERSESIRASLRLRSRINAGTEIELTVPGEIAFEGAVSRRFPWWN
jgi:signal transduction histidine kinase